ncbi:MAG: diadenylate cyclase CdaA [Bacillota bacterium]|jgi:diadenylate cyclase
MKDLLAQINYLNVFAEILDILIVAYVIYKLLMLIKGTRAVQLIKGILFLLIASNISDFFNLYTIKWILDQTWATIFVALAVIFQPELRRALEQIGRGQFFVRMNNELGMGDMLRLIDEVTRCVLKMARTNTGTLIILERETGINDYIETGIKIDGIVSAEFLSNIFVPQTPLHDGAVIIRGDRVIAAGCFLPLSDNPYLDSSLGTRHRAALGITEISDALAVIVSEETGTISIAYEGKLVRYLEERTLRDKLQELLVPKPNNNTHFWQRRVPS